MRFELIPNMGLVNVSVSTGNKNVSNSKVTCGVCSGKFNQVLRLNEVDMCMTCFNMHLELGVVN